MADTKIMPSPLSGPYSEGGLTVDVRIYRLEDSKWALEVIDSEGTSTVWDDQFDTDDAAKSEFNRCIAEEGIVSLTPVRN
jgi:uncharacterized protein